MNRLSIHNHGSQIGSQHYLDNSVTFPGQHSYMPSLKSLISPSNSQQMTSPYFFLPIQKQKEDSYKQTYNLLNLVGVSILFLS